MFRADDRAVSPTIAAAILVAITVTLATAAGTYVLFVGDSETPDGVAPQAAVTPTVDTSGCLKLKHKSGDPLQYNRTAVKITYPADNATTDTAAAPTPTSTSAAGANASAEPSRSARITSLGVSAQYLPPSVTTGSVFETGWGAVSSDIRSPSLRGGEAVGIQMDGQSFQQGETVTVLVIDKKTNTVVVRQTATVAANITCPVQESFFETLTVGHEKTYPFITGLVNTTERPENGTWRNHGQVGTRTETYVNTTWARTSPGENWTRTDQYQYREVQKSERYMVTIESRDKPTMGEVREEIGDVNWADSYRVDGPYTFNRTMQPTGDTLTLYEKNGSSFWQKENQGWYCRQYGCENNEWRYYEFDESHRAWDVQALWVEDGPPNDYCPYYSCGDWYLTPEWKIGMFGDVVWKWERGIKYDYFVYEYTEYKPVWEVGYTLKWTDEVKFWKYQNKTTKTFPVYKWVKYNNETHYTTLTQNGSADYTLASDKRAVGELALTVERFRLDNQSDSPLTITASDGNRTLTTTVYRDGQAIVVERNGTEAVRRTAQNITLRYTDGTVTVAGTESSFDAGAWKHPHDAFNGTFSVRVENGDSAHGHLRLSVGPSD